MKLSSKDLIRLSNIAISAAVNAGEFISKYNSQNLLVKNKKAEMHQDDKSKVGESIASQVVTEVDLKSQEMILSELLPTCKKYDLALLTEESIDDLSRFEKEYFWCIDPLDGTLPFIESTTGYSVSISLVSRLGVPFIGVVFDPIEKNLYYAVKGQGAYKNQELWKISSLERGAKRSFNFIADRSFLKNEFYIDCRKELKAIAIELGCNAFNDINHGGAVMNACWTLESAPACYFKFPKTETGGGSLWDYSATACIYNEIRGAVSDIFGNALDLNRPDSTFMNHRGVLFATDSYISNRIIDFYAKLPPQINP